MINVILRFSYKILIVKIICDYILEIICEDSMEGCTSDYMKKNCKSEYVYTRCKKSCGKCDAGWCSLKLQTHCRRCQELYLSSDRGLRSPH